MDTTSNKVFIPAIIKGQLMTCLSNEIGVAINFALDERTSDKAFGHAKAEAARQAYSWLVSDTVAA